MSINHTKNIIEIKNVSLAYDKEPVLKNINLNIHEGDYLGIIGPNGGGKTTLIKIILGLIKPTTGIVTLKTQQLGYVPQKVTNFDVNFPITVKEVVAQGRIAQRGLFHNLDKEDWKIVEKSLATVELLDQQNKLLSQLSVGQQQRVFIARAISASHPHVIFLDEPTSGIDQHSQKHFYSFLKHLNRDLGITLVLISHDVDIITHEVSHVALVNQKLEYYGDPKLFIEKHYLSHHQHDS